MRFRFHLATPAALVLPIPPTPTDVAFDPPGEGYAVDSLNHRIQRFSPTAHGNGPGQFVSPRLMELDGRGVVHVPDQDKSKIQTLRISPS